MFLGSEKVKRPEGRAPGKQKARCSDTQECMPSYNPYPRKFIPFRGYRWVFA